MSKWLEAINQDPINIIDIPDEEKTLTICRIMP